MLALICDIFNSILITMFREVPPALKSVLIIVFLLLSLFFLAKTIRVGGKADKMPINIGFFLLFILFFTLCMLYIWL